MLFPMLRKNVENRTAKFKRFLRGAAYNNSHKLCRSINEKLLYENFLETGVKQ